MFTIQCAWRRYQTRKHKRLIKAMTLIQAGEYRNVVSFVHSFSSKRSDNKSIIVVVVVAAAAVTVCVNLFLQ